LGYNCIVRLSHTTSMLTPHSLFRSKIFFCNMSTNLMRLYYCLNCINYYLLYIYILLCQELLKAGSFQGDFIIITQKAKKRSRKIILNVDLVVGLQICINNVEKANLKVNLSPFTTYLRASSLCGEGNPVTRPSFQKCSLWIFVESHLRGVKTTSYYNVSQICSDNS